MRLVERDHELKCLARVLTVAQRGTGAGVAVVGEPGVGKSAVVDTACGMTTGLGFLKARCDPLTTPRPLGPFRDAISELSSLPRTPPWPGVRRGVQRSPRTPTVLVIEDLHWVDGASIEVLRFLVRRREAMRCAVVVTYRDDDIGPHHPARPLLGDFAALDHLTMGVCLR